MGELREVEVQAAIFEGHSTSRSYPAIEENSEIATLSFLFVQGEVDELYRDCTIHELEFGLGFTNERRRTTRQIITPIKAVNPT